MKAVHIFPLELADAEKTFPHLQNDEIYHYIPDLKHTEIDSLKNRYNLLIQGARQSNEVWLNWVIYKEATKETAIGTLQATLFLEKKMAYVGYVIFQEFWNQGYATSGLNWLVQFLNCHSNLKYIEAYVDMQNRYSIRLLEQAGFIQIARDEADWVYRRNLDGLS